TRVVEFPHEQIDSRPGRQDSSNFRIAAHPSRLYQRSFRTTSYNFVPQKHRHTVPKEIHQMKRFLLLLLAVAVPALPVFAQVSAETWNLDPAHSAAHFAVRHMGISTVRGAFSKLSGTVNYDPAHPEQSAVDVTIDATSIDTRVEMRDKDLRSPNFFDVE